MEKSIHSLVTILGLLASTAFAQHVATSPAAIRSGTYYWDYRLGRSVTSTGPFTLLTVNAGKTFVLTDIYMSGNTDMIIYEGANIKFTIS